METAISTITTNVCDALLHPEQITEEISLHASTCEAAMVAASVIVVDEEDGRQITPSSYMSTSLTTYLQKLEPEIRNTMIAAIRTHGLYNATPFDPPF
jgi:DNA-directed RNA polymerase subunit M/transcription elongation factor TFIIS